MKRGPIRLLQPIQYREDPEAPATAPEPEDGAIRHDDEGGVFVYDKAKQEWVPKPPSTDETEWRTIPGYDQDRDALVRYTELRYEGNRSVSGTALKYGDEAVIFGEKERFEPGAFGDLSKADVVLNLQHTRFMPIARTGGGGMTVSDDGGEVYIRAELPDTQPANDTLTLVRARVLRGLSIEFRPKDWRYDGKEGDRTLVIEKAELRGVAVVDRPAYGQSLLDPRAEAQEILSDMTPEEVRRMIEDALKQRADDGGQTLDVDALVTRIVDATTKSREAESDAVKAQIEAAFKERDEAREAKEKADTERAEAEAKAEAERKEAEDKAAQERADFEAEAERRAEYRHQFRELYAEGFDTAGKSSRELLVAAVGSEVSDADKESRSEDWLELKAQGILESKQEAERSAPAGGGNGGLNTKTALPTTASAGTGEWVDYKASVNQSNPSWSGSTQRFRLFSERSAENAKKNVTVGGGE